MTRNVRALLVAVLLVSGSSPHVQAEPTLSVTDPALQRFVRAYMSAVAAHDVVALKRVIHPASLACINTTNRDFFDAMLAREVARATAQYRTTRVSPLTSDALPPGLRYPVRPTHEVQIDFETGPTESTTLIRQIAAVNGSWFNVVQCPTEEGLRAFREGRIAAQKARARAETLAAAIEQPLLSELKQLLGQHRRVEAIKTYQAQSGVDLTTASQVMDVIEHPSRSGP